MSPEIQTLQDRLIERTRQSLTTALRDHQTICTLRQDCAALLASLQQARNYIIAYSANTPARHAIIATLEKHPQPTFLTPGPN